ncbi:MAG: hypothetical protein Aurels2KO_14060 [Aureliella sp.]
MIELEPFCQRLCFALLHSLWQVALLALLATACRFLLGPSRDRIAYWVHVGALAVGVMALPFNYQFLASPLTPMSTETSSQFSAAGESTALESAVVGRASSGEIASPSIRGSSPTGRPLTANSVAQSDAMNPRETERIRSLSGGVIAESMPWLISAYAIGVIIMLVRLLRSAILIERLRSATTKIVDGPVLETFHKLCRRYSLKLTPAIAHSEQVVVPKVVGLLKPTVLLPTSALTGLSTDEVEMILAHELAHIRRHDLWMILFQRFTEAILFFNPAVWWLSRRISLLREFCCDDQAIASTSVDEPNLQYAGALLQCVRLSGTQHSEQATALAASGRSPSELRRRVARLLGEPLREPLRLSRVGVFVLLLGLVASSTPWLWAFNSDQGATNEAPAASQSATKQLHAVAISNTSKIADLIKKGAAIDDVDASGTTPLWKAVRFGKVESVRALLAAGANPDIPRKSDGWTPLLCNAFVNKHPVSTQIAGLLLARKAKVDSATIRDGERAMHFAVRVAKSPELVELLLDAGANVDSLSIRNSTPLQFAVANGSIELVELLLSRGADPTIRNDSGFRPIDQINATTVENAKKIQDIFKSHGADSLRRPDLIRKHIEESKKVAATPVTVSATRTDETATEQPGEPQVGSSLLVALRDVDGKPVTKTRVRLYDGKSFYAGRPPKFKMQIVATDAKGIAKFNDFFKKVPGRVGYWIDVFRDKDAAWRPPQRLVGWEMDLSKSVLEDPLMQSEKTAQGLRIDITLRQECPTDIEIVDSTNGKRRHFAQLFFKDDRVDDWTRAALQDYVGDPGGDDPSRLGLDFSTTLVPEMSDAQFMATRQGYYPLQFKLKEKLRVDKKLRQRISLVPAPLIELTILDASGKPVQDARLKYLGPDMRGSYRTASPTDAQGRVLLLYPELGRMARFMVTHPSGTCEFSMADLPAKPQLHWQTTEEPDLGVIDPNYMKDDERWALIRHTLQLRSTEAR